MFNFNNYLIYLLWLLPINALLWLWLKSMKICFRVLLVYKYDNLGDDVINHQLYKTLSACSHNIEKHFTLAVVNNFIIACRTDGIKRNCVTVIFLNYFIICYLHILSENIGKALAALCFLMMCLKSSKLLVLCYFEINIMWLFLQVNNWGNNFELQMKTYTFITVLSLYLIYCSYYTTTKIKDTVLRIKKLNNWIGLQNTSQKICLELLRICLILSL